MSANDRALIIPPAAEGDPESFELLRLWAANGELHVVVESSLDGGPEDFGGMLADLARHGALLYSQREGISPLDALRRGGPPVTSHRRGARSKWWTLRWQGRFRGQVIRARRATPPG